MARLWRAMRNQERVRVLTRGLREPRAILKGNLIAFDRYWNLILSDVTECFVRMNASTLAGHTRVGRGKRRRQQRFVSFFTRSEDHFKSGEAVDFQSVRQQWKEYRQRKRETVNTEEPHVGLTYVDLNGSADSAAVDLRTQVISKSALMDTTSACTILSLVATKQSRYPVDKSKLFPSGCLATDLVHHGQLFIRGANIVHVSFLTSSIGDCNP